jgi:hypothetical protein
MDHALKARAIQTDRAIRAADNVQATAKLLLSGLDPETMRELLDLQRAAWRRYSALQKGFVADWIGWFDYADRIKGANTMSKLVEMESNILAQAAQLMGTQITSLVALQENIEVDYSYLVRQILADRNKPAGPEPQYPG